MFTLTFNLEPGFQAIDCSRKKPVSAMCWPCWMPELTRWIRPRSTTAGRYQLW